MVTCIQIIRQASSDTAHCDREGRTDLQGTYSQPAGHSDKNRSRSFQTHLVGGHTVVGGKTNQPPCNLTPPLDKVHLPYDRDFTGNWEPACLSQTQHQTSEHLSSPKFNHKLEAEFRTLSPPMQGYVRALEQAYHAELTRSTTSASHPGSRSSHRGETEPLTSKVQDSMRTRYHLQNGLCCVHHGGEDPSNGIVPDAAHRCQDIIISDSDPHVKISIYVIASRPRNDRQQAAYQGQVNLQTMTDER